MTAVGWQVEHLFTGLRGQLPHAVSVFPRPRVSFRQAEIATCRCGYRGVMVPPGATDQLCCPVHVTRASTDGMWLELLEDAFWERSDRRWGRPVQRVVAQAPGRNDPCDCGSGRKAKKCCYA